MPIVGLGYNEGQCIEKAAYAERCRPDYESMIEGAQNQRAVIGKLLNAFYEYFKMFGFPGQCGPDSTGVATYIGILECDSRNTLKKIESWMEQAEKDPA